VPVLSASAFLKAYLLLNSDRHPGMPTTHKVRSRDGYPSAPAAGHSGKCPGRYDYGDGTARTAMSFATTALRWYCPRRIMTT
jgi:hypothetical protein